MKTVWVSLLVISVCGRFGSAQTPDSHPYPIPVGSIAQWGIGTGCDDPGEPTKATKGTPQQPRPCAWINAPAQPASPFAVSFVTPKGAVEFQFQVSLLSAPAGTDATYTVTATATDSSGGSQTGSGTATLHLAGANKSAHALLRIPINIDAAEATVTFQYALSQSKGGVAPPQADRQSAYGPFRVAVTPIALFQLPVVPIAILYAPLGDNGTSSLGFTATTGTNVQITNSTSSGTDVTQDNKTTLSAGLTYAVAGEPAPAGAPKPADAPKNTFGLTDSATWDDSVQKTNSASYGVTNSIVTSDQVSYAFQLSASKFTPPPVSISKMNSTATSDEPFWHDQFLLALNGQFAIWDYPSGPIVQPLANVALVEVSVAQLDDCRQGVAGANVLTYDSSGTTASLSLTPQDCNNILHLDQFWAGKKQSAFPNNYRKLWGGGSTSSQLNVSNTQAVTSGTQQNAQTSFTSKSTSTRTNSLAASASIPVVQGLTFTASGSYVTTNTTVQNATITYQAVTSVTATNSFTASTSVVDSALNGGSFHANVMVVQDLNFQGLAVQDSDMNWPQTVHLKKITNRQMPADLTNFPVVRPNGSTADLPKTGGIRPQKYVRDSGYDWVVITEPSAQQKTAARTQAQALFTAASKRHIQRPLLKPAPASAIPMSADEAVKFVNRLPVPPASMQRFADALKRSGQ
jgi:hypothetical protein